MIRARVMAPMPRELVSAAGKYAYLKAEGVVPMPEGDRQKNACIAQKQRKSIGVGRTRLLRHEAARGSGMGSVDLPTSVADDVLLVGPADARLAVVGQLTSYQTAAPLSPQSSRKPMMVAEA
jgi:hypothetical protein